MFKKLMEKLAISNKIPLLITLVEKIIELKGLDIDDGEDSVDAATVHRMALNMDGRRVIRVVNFLKKHPEITGFIIDHIL